MNPRTLLCIQLMENFSGKVRVMVRFGVILLLSLPFIVINMPSQVKASGLVMVVLFTTFFGAAIGHTRLCEDGRFSRLCMLPIRRPLLWLDLILSAAVARIIPTFLLLGGFVLINSPVLTLAGFIKITAVLCEAILMLVILAMVVGHVSRDNGQVHLFGALTCVVIAFFSGVIPAASKLSFLAEALAVNPLYILRGDLDAMTTGAQTTSLLELTGSILVLTLLATTIMVRWIPLKVANN